MLHLNKMYKKINANFKNETAFTKMVSDLCGSFEGKTSTAVVTETATELVAA